MFSHWVVPVSKNLISQARASASGFLGTQIDFHLGDSKKLPKGGVVMIGFEPAAADLVRSRIFPFASPHEHLRITDLGNFRKTESDFCIPLIQELLGSGHFVVLLGKSEEIGLTQFLAYRDFKRVSNLAIIDQQLLLAFKDMPADATATWQQVLQPIHKRLFHFCLLAAQAHLMPPQVTKFLEKKAFDTIRLGALRNDLASAEPALRDMDLVAVHLRALRSINQDAYHLGTASGLTVEELCQLGRYAGMSEKVSSFSIAGIPDSGNDAYLIDAAAQLIWYVLEGVAQRHGDFPVSVHDMTEYIVGLQKLKYQLTFWRSNKTGRWWVQVPVSIEKNKERHRLVPCTYHDYQKASQEELSDRLIRAFERFM
jgi:formiminoglutamase